MNREEILDEQFKELSAMSPMTISMPPDRGYMLAAIVQTASIYLDLPETTQAFCKEFVNGFCDRYRENMPTVVKVIEDAWQNPELMTEDEFAEVLGKKWRHIAQEVEEEMGGEVKITVDKPHRGALCPVDGEPCSKGGNFYYYPNDCPAYEMCEDAASRINDGDIHDEFFEVVKDIYQDIEGVGEYLTIITRKEVDDDDLEDRCASGHTN
jgi:hypothetical protein